MESALTPFEAFEKAVAVAGGQSAFARAVGCTQGNIGQLLKRRCQLSARFVLAAEASTGISRHLLRPDIYPDESAPNSATSTRPLGDLEPAR